MEKYIRIFAQRFSYPSEAVEALLDGYLKLSVYSAFNDLLKKYDADLKSDAQEMIRQVKELGKTAGVHEYTAALVLLICLSKRLKEYYVCANLPESVWEKSMYDLKYKLLECKEVYGIWGTFTEWFGKFYSLERFGLERLQFEIVKCKYACIVRGVHITTESDVVNVHIPRSGERLTRESLDASYKCAYEFFKNRFPNGKMIFACDSWLLFPKHLEMLSPTSNLYSFISDYEIVSFGEFEDFSQGWRLFDMQVTKDNLDSLPQNTSLRRAYVDLMKRGEKTGYGYGVFVYPKE